MFRPNRSRGRTMQPGQLIHESVLVYMKLKENNDYRPSAKCAGDTITWDDIKTKDATALQDFIVRDLYNSAEDIMKDLDREIGRAHV